MCILGTVGCGKNKMQEKNDQTVIVDATNIIGETTVETHDVSEEMSDQQILDIIIKYCYDSNPDLKDIVDAGEYPVYWDIASSDENEIVIIFRSYTGAQKRFYIDRNSGDTYVTEFVPGITDEEEPTGESFNIKEQ